MSAMLKLIIFQKTNMMKKYRLLLFVIVIACSSNVFGQAGYLGKRCHFVFDTRFSPTIITPVYTVVTKYCDFNTHFSPSFEYVVNRDWVIGASYQFEHSKYTPEYSSHNEIPIPPPNYTAQESDIDLYGFGIYAKYYTNPKAPLGYYYKFGLDYFTYTATGEIKYDYLPMSTTFKGEDWALGFRVEFGKTVLVSNYISLGTGLSLGALTNGYRFMSIDKLNEPMDQASTRVLANYFIGVNLTLGILPF
ncbi:MAG: hypothetical protein H6Q16_157 [Bacteroidetes bacterium]|nr:hypothetical protein [Bacteroidota bacterium]